MRGGEHCQEQAAEQSRQHPDGQEEARPGCDPARAVGGEATARHDHMDMRMVRHRRAPCVQHGSDADPGAQPTFPTLLEGFFTQRLMQQRQASAHTIASYRDTFRLLLRFARERLHRAPSVLAFGDIDATLVADFLDELEKVRNVTARTRNLRLTAIHSFFRYVAFEAPEHAAQIQRVLAIPAKRFTRALVPFLSRQEVDALIAAPDQRIDTGVAVRPQLGADPDLAR
jgi:hypothetical protein